jgi:hypothetical protein
MVMLNLLFFWHRTEKRNYKELVWYGLVVDNYIHQSKQSLNSRQSLEEISYANKKIPNLEVFTLYTWNLDG